MRDKKRTGDWMQMIYWPCVIVCVFFFKQKTAYEIGTGDWSSDVCSSDLPMREYQGDEMPSDISSVS